MPCSSQPFCQTFEDRTCSLDPARHQIGHQASDCAESVVLTDKILIQYLHVLLPRILPGERLWPKDSQSFRMQFRLLCTDARLPALPWRPYSIRRGGATAHFLQFGSLDKTAVRGRWQSTRTATVYINEGIAALTSIVTTPAQNLTFDLWRKWWPQQRYLHGETLENEPHAVRKVPCSFPLCGDLDRFPFYSLEFRLSTTSYTTGTI